ncbi:MAG TPA: FAD/NAD(P)-binding oxidoreductase, partial [Ktedonobacteraceae bacterium]
DHCSLPLRRKKGIVVDDQLRTSVPDIFAAGDVAALKNPQTGDYEPRAVWYAAVNQARIVGAMMAGREDLARQPFGVQWHATHLGELSMLTVGDPMLEDNRIDMLTDVSQSGYRRMTIAGDRLVGYLSLGSEPPDSLAIKRIIDEGLPIRNVIKSLLKGKLDARQFVSEQRSRFAQGMLTGQLSASQMPPQLIPMNAQLTPLPPVHVKEPPVASVKEKEQAMFYEEISSFSGQLPTLRQQPESSFEHEPLTEEISSFSGQLPSLGRQSTEELRSFSSRRPTPQVQETSPSFLVEQPAERDPFAEDVSPFTGNLPTMPARAHTTASAPTGTNAENQRSSRREALQATMVPVPPNELRPGRTGGLWAYSDEAPKEKQRSVEESDRGDYNPLPRRRSSRSLWSYSDKDQPIEKGR